MKCSNCQHSQFKLVKRNYLVKSRNVLRSQTVMEDLLIQECKICGEITIPEESKHIIALYRKKIREEMENMSSDSLHLGSIKDTIKKLIG